MSNSNIKITSSEIKDSKAFASLTRIQQKIYLNPNSRRAIENSVNVVINIGFEKWENQTHSSCFHREVVKELVNKKKK